MDKNGLFPKTFNPAKPYRPLKAPQRDKKGDDSVECDDSPTLMESIHLGAHTKTDVFELSLKNPISNEYIADDAEGRVVATTLAVALRAALAEQLGISTSELGYALRPAIVSEGEVALVIQLFDTISGGAGFASSAHLHVESLLRKMVRNLECQSCETACGDCLLQSNTRRDSDSLDRQAAKDWLGDGFINFVGLPDDVQLLAGGYYQPNSIDQAVRHWINQGATSVLFQLPNDFNNWDLLNPKFRNSLVTYLAKDNVDVTVVLPNVELDSETEIEVIALQNLGVNFALSPSQAELNSNIAVQLKTRSNIVSLATDTYENLTPGVGWLNAGGLVVESVQLNLVDTKPKFFEVSTAKQSAKNGEWEITTQLNGKLMGFGERFWMHLFKNDGDELLRLLSNGPVVEVAYSDRYQQSPASLLLITQVLGSLCNVLSAKPVLKVATLFSEKERSGQFLHQDWLYQDDHFAVFKRWIEHKAKVEPVVTVVDSRADIAHRRLLTLTLASGKKINFKLDQGMGYWRLFDPQSHFQSIRFGFELDPGHQLAQLQKLEREIAIRNSEDWSTDISYSIHE